MQEWIRLVCFFLLFIISYFYFILNLFISLYSSILTKLELFACIFSAIIHDCDHPGCNNNFLIATNHPLAITHNDISPLENHHCSTGFKIARESNIFKDMSSTE